MARVLWVLIGAILCGSATLPAIALQECPIPSTCSVSAPTAACAEEWVNLHATCVPPDGGGIQYFWRHIGSDDYTGGGTDASWTYYHPGTYHWELTVYHDAWGTCKVAEGDIVITEPLLTCSPSVPASAQPAEQVTLRCDITSSCTPPAYFKRLWTYLKDDGTTASVYGGAETRVTWYKEGVYPWTFDGYTPQESGHCGPFSGEIVIGCALSCSATVPSTEMAGVPVQFASTPNYGTCSGIPTYSWTFGDNQTSSDRSPSHAYASPGTYPWTLLVTIAGKTCSKNGTITITPPACALTCAATVPEFGSPGSPVAFAATASSPYCSGSPTFAWTFGDTQFSGEQNPSHTYPNAGTYPWTLTVTVDGKTCTKSGTITVRLNCLAVGPYLKFCADSISPPTPQGNNTYRLHGHASVNETLVSTADFIFTGDPDLGTGTLSTTGNVFVRLASGDTTVLSGPVSFTVDGWDASITPVHDPNKPLFSFTLQGVKLYQMGFPWQFRLAGLILKPWIEIGNRLVNFQLGLVEVELILPPGGSVQLSSSNMVAGTFQKYYTLADSHFTYLPPPADTLGGNLEVSYPSLGTWALRSEILVEDGCIDTLLATPSPPSAITLLGTPLILEEPVTSLERICSGPDSTPHFKAVLGRWLRDSSHYFFFVLGDAELVYFPPRIYRVRAGTLSFSEARLQIDEGTLSTWPEEGVPYGLMASGNLLLQTPPLLDGKMVRAFFTREELGAARAEGDYQGKLRVEAPSCYEGMNQCLYIRGLVRSAVGNVAPFTFMADRCHLHFEAKQRLSGLKESGWKGGVRISGEWLNVDIADDQSVTYGLSNDPLSLSEAAFGGTRSAVERTVTLAGQKDWAVFSVSGRNSLPYTYLKLPTGVTVTPENVGNFPGVQYLAYPDDKVAFYIAKAAPAGIWAFGEDNLPESEVTFSAFASVPPQNLAFTSVSQTGSSVSIETVLAPTTPSATVSLFYGRSSDGTTEGNIAQDLPASHGSVLATWDTSQVPTGTYYLVARGDDGTSVPLTAVYAQPITVKNAGPEPPSGLTGTFGGTTATLAWTPSPSNVEGYTVHYTDAPSVPGYTWAVATNNASGTSVEDLDPGKNYRFAVAAFDEQGRASLESAPWTAGNCAVSVDPSAPPASGVGQPAAFKANASAPNCAAAPTFDWDFGDGTPHASLADPTHSYLTPGTFTWKLVASSGASREEITGQIYIDEQKVCTLSCAAQAPATAKAGDGVAFTAAGEPTWCMGVPAYSWDFGDGTTSAEQNPTHAYAVPGTFTWSATASIGGNTCTTRGSILISNPTPGDCDNSGTVSIGEVQKAINMFLGTLAPGCGVDASEDGVVSIGEVQKVINAFLGVVPGIRVNVSPATATVAQNGSQQFTATVTGTTNTAVTWSVQEGPSGGTVNATGLYTAPATSGVFHVRATSQADSTKSGSAAVTVTGGTCSLTCTASASPASGQAPLAVNFTATATPANCSGSVTYAWTFGDGGSSSQQSPSHTYLAAGTYSWTMTASVDGQTCSKSGSITVSGQSNCSLTCSASANPSSGDAPLSVNFGAGTTATDCTGAVTYSWTFGDGSTATQQAPVHTYTTAGTYTWTMTASVDGQTCTQSGSVTVAEAQNETPLTLGVPVAGSIMGTAHNASWRWYYLDLATGPQAIDVDLTGLNNDVDLYVGVGQKPSVESFNCSSTNNGTNPEHCSAGATGPVRVWVGVTNWATGVTINFTITASSHVGGCEIAGCSVGTQVTGLTVTFTGDYNAVSCTQAPAFSWLFGDGTTSSQQNPVHTFPTAGGYSWTFDVVIGDQHCRQDGNVIAGSR